MNFRICKNDTGDNTCGGEDISVQRWEALRRKRYVNYIENQKVEDGKDNFQVSDEFQS